MVSRRTSTLIQLLGSAVVMQALLSASSLIAGLIMIRRTSDLQYGYYVLVLNAILLLVTLQNSFIQPQLVVRITRADAAERAKVVGGLYRSQRRLWPIIAAAVVLGGILTWLAGLIHPATLLVLIAAAVAVSFALYREFFRMVLLGYRRPVDVLRADAVYVALLLGGVVLATLTSAPATVAALSLGVAALIGGIQCSRALWRFEAWNIRGVPGILQAFAPLGIWAAGGASVHWLFSQGYNYMVAGMLHVSAVAAIAATRLTIMPINLLSTGLGTMMLPTAAAWLNTHGAPRVLRRMIVIAVCLGATAICYFAVVWLLRDWLFIHVLKKEFPQRDQLLLMWFAVGLATLLRDQLLYLLTVRERFRLMSSLTLVCALVSFAISYYGILHFGVMGALVGVLAGELLNVGGLIILSAIESQRRPAIAPA